LPRHEIPLADDPQFAYPHGLISRGNEGAAMNWLEWVAAALGVANVALVVRRSVWNYPFGIAMVALYSYIFYREYLFSDALLQIFFFVVNIYGWANWLRSKANAGEVVVVVLSWRARAAWAVGCVAATAGWGWLMYRYTPAAYPWWDGSVAMLSVAGQILMSRRYLENWWLWIAADLAAIPLYAVKGLQVTAWLYLLFLLLSIAGLIGWQRARGRLGEAQA
jgi:nicotinamide mononucleotide transporter